MKNMKKIAALGMSAVMVAGMMAGCGSSSDSSSSDSKGSSKSGDKVELTLGIWDENQRDAMQKMIDAYEAENDNVSISIQLTPYKGGEYWTKLEASAGGGTAPDVFWLNVLHLDSYVEGGILDDLSDAIASSDIKDNFAETLVNNYVRQMIVLFRILRIKEIGVVLHLGFDSLVNESTSDQLVDGRISCRFFFQRS